MTDLWFSSDLHLGHKFVASMRGFDDPDEHDEVILNNFENTVGPDDVLWILGDLSSGALRAEERALGLIAERLGGVVKQSSILFLETTILATRCTGMRTSDSGGF